MTEGIQSSTTISEGGHILSPKIEDISNGINRKNKQPVNQGEFLFIN